MYKSIHSKKILLLPGMLALGILLISFGWTLESKGAPPFWGHWELRTGNSVCGSLACAEWCIDNEGESWPTGTYCCLEPGDLGSDQRNVCQFEVDL